MGRSPFPPEKETDNPNIGKPKGGGIKFDTGKPRFDLIDPAALEGLARVLNHGAVKYAPHNWRKGIAYSRLIRAALGHIYSFMRGEECDQESGLCHIDHAMCNLMFISYFRKTPTTQLLDDRFEWSKPDA